MVTAYPYPVSKNTWYVTLTHHINDTHPLNGEFDSIYNEPYGIYYHPDNLNLVENLIISFYLYEPRFNFDCSSWIQSSLDFCQTSNIFPNLKNVYLLYDGVNIRLENIHSNYNVSKLHIQYYLLRSSLNYQRSNYGVCTEWKPNDSKPLFLLGNGIRLNRFPVLYEFFINDNIDILEYSLDFKGIHYTDDFFTNIVHDQFFQQTSEQFNITKAELINDYIHLQYSFKDNYRNAVNAIGHFNASAYYYPIEWKKSPLILVSETYFLHPSYYDHEWNNESNSFSEKIFKPLLTKKPFISCGFEDGQYRQLEEMGFRTFLEYTGYPDKIMINWEHCPNWELRKHAQLTYNRVLGFLENMQKYQKQIENDVNHNYLLWRKLCEDEWSKLYKECPPLSTINKITVSDMFILGLDGPKCFLDENRDQL